MKSSLKLGLSGICFAVFGIIFVSSQLVSAEESPSAAVAVDAGNKICPVTGEKIVDDTGGTVEYQGKIYHLCCSMCKKDFMKDPDAAIKKLEQAQSEEEVK